MRSIWLACLLVTAPAAALAEDQWTWSGAVSLATAYMDYHETGADGMRLNRERGYLPGIGAKMRGQSDTGSAGFDLQYFAGDARYEGSTNTGVSIATRTDQRIGEGSAWLGWRAFEQPRIQLDLYAGAGLRRWNRDIRSTRNASGLDETYNWPYLLAGLHARHGLADGSSLRLDVRLLSPVDPSLRVDFKNGYDSVKLHQQAQAGGRLSLAWTRAWNNHRSLAISAWYEQWRFNAGPAEQLRLNGTPIGTVLEPASRTEFVGIAITLGGPGL